MNSEEICEFGLILIFNNFEREIQEIDYCVYLQKNLSAKSIFDKIISRIFPHGSFYQEITNLRV